MSTIDKAILDTDKVICRNIDNLCGERGFLSQNILSHLRNLIEYISQKIFVCYSEPNDYESKKKALKNLKYKKQGELKFLYDFHELLQKSVSHYTLDENSSERLMLKYYEYLLKTKSYLKNHYELEILGNIHKFPINIDKGLQEYYEKIYAKIFHASKEGKYLDYQDRYYIKKVKPVFFNGDVFYEVTFNIADDKVSKFDRIIAFTRLDILNNYAVKLNIREEFIDVLENKMPIKIIDAWEVSIRPCELKSFSKIFGMPSVHHASKEYSALMYLLTSRNINFLDVIKFEDNEYDNFKQEIIDKAKTDNFVRVLDRCRSIVLGQIKGCNVIAYLLYRLNNKIIKKQYSENKCHQLSDLNLSYGCIPFDEMPFATSLVNHNPTIYDLMGSINDVGREHEFLARSIKNKTETDGTLFVHKNNLVNFPNLSNLLQTYNGKIYHKHNNRKLIEYGDYIYTKGYVEDCNYIIDKIKSLSKSGLSGYANSVDSWLENTSNNIDCPQKLGLLKNMFKDSKVSLIYGSAGTGKSTMINHISKFWSDKNKVFLTNTNPAINNLKRKVTSSNCTFYTINKFLISKHINRKMDILIIDECSTVSNRDMKEILNVSKFELLVLVGDSYQIESIVFGNWFYIIKDFIKSSSILELTIPYRTSNKKLLTIWDRVRNLDIAILEPLVKNDYSTYLDTSILEKREDDEIILCLNYDGIYGINNINKFLQSSNENEAITWGVNTYKIGDPILFNEIERFYPLIHNNMKGKIIDINKYDKKIDFTIELDIAINELDAKIYDFTLLGNSNNSNSIIRFSVNQYPGTDEDDDSSSSLVPFQIAYAVSIHKAQGLEYKSVKIVVTNEVQELVTHNIFYTAITRAKEKLKIYWSPESEKKVLEGFKLKNSNIDIGLLRKIMNN
ncbi:ATP-dependent DNA helicase [Pasteurella oralis]|uniref:ATP-dependent DNA helicase n=1 Tax=Pasteurella oralis TaxID=1071947 RepID=UPI000C7C73D5|nr:ATP-dependent RecD-like DNA helicase [Pasteurella oralis]